MSRTLKVKTAILGVIVVVSMVAMGMLLSSMQDRLSLEDAVEEIGIEQDELPGLIESAAQDAEQNEAAFDAVYQSKAESVVYLAAHQAGFEATDAKMQEYKDLLDVDNVLVVDRSGAVLAKAQDTPADFARARFNLLRTSFDTGEPSAGMEVHYAESGETMRYYAGVSLIDDVCYVSMIPESDLVASRNITLGVILFIFFSVMTTVVLYGLFISREDEKRAAERHGGKPAERRVFGLRHHRRHDGRAS